MGERKLGTPNKDSEKLSLPERKKACYRFFKAFEKISGVSLTDENIRFRTDNFKLGNNICRYEKSEENASFWILLPYNPDLGRYLSGTSIYVGVEKNQKKIVNATFYFLYPPEHHTDSNNQIACENIRKILKFLLPTNQQQPTLQKS